MIAPASGHILIAEPFLKDPPFIRSVILLCTFSEDDGAFGFTLNKICEDTLDELIPDMEGYTLPVYSGGPVQTDTLHYLHNYPEHFSDCQKVAENIYWGGDFELLKTLIKNNTIAAKEIKFFLGYSGWTKGQLEEEIAEETWLLTEANSKLVFNTAHEKLWNESLIKLGGKYKLLIHYPTDPQLN